MVTKLFELDEPFNIDGVWTVVTMGTKKSKDGGLYVDQVMRIYTTGKSKPIVSIKMVCYMFLFIAMNENGLYPRPNDSGDGKFRKGIQVGLEAGYKAISAYIDKERGSIMRRA